MTNISIWRDNLANFADLAMRFSESQRLVSKWHIGYLCEILTAVQKKQIRNINIIIPPGHTKTFLTIRAFVPWLLGHDQSARCMYVRRKTTLADEQVGLTKRFMDSDVYKSIFPDVELDKKGDSKFTLLNKRGYLEARGVEGAVTGANADLLICDDIVDAGDGVNVIHTICNNITAGFFTRLRDNEKVNNYGAIFINQRLNMQDQTAFLQENYDFHNFIIPFIEEEGKTYSFNNFSYSRPIGEVLNPQITTVDKVKERIGDWDKTPHSMSIFQTQYQQNPTDDLNAIVKAEWFNYYQNIDNIRLKYIIITADTATKKGEHNDYTVISAWGVSQEDGKKRIWLLDMYRNKVEWNELEKDAINFYNKWKMIKNHDNNIFCNSFYIEDKVSGTSLIQKFKSSTNIPVKAIQRDKNKYERLCAVVSYIENGCVYLPKDNKNAKTLVQECISFRQDDSHLSDDCLDTLIDALFFTILDNNNLKMLNDIYDRHF